MCLHTVTDQNVHRLEKILSTKYHAKATWTVLLDWSFVMGALQYLHLLTVLWSSGQHRFIWSKTDTLKITTSTSQLIVTSAHYIYHSTRLATSKNLFLPRVNSSSGKCSLKFIGPKVWSSIPDDIKFSTTFAFKWKLKKHLLFEKKIPNYEL